MSNQDLELQFEKAEAEREASERQIEANIRIKERIEKMEQGIHSIQVSVDTLTRRMTEFLNKHGQKQLEAYTKLIKYLDDWK